MIYIVQAACQAVDCDALIVHADADDHTSERALRERYQPGYQLDALDDDIKAFVTVLRDQAFEDAERLEREMRTGLYRSQLHGIPIGVKDITSRR